MKIQNILLTIRTQSGKGPDPLIVNVDGEHFTLQTVSGTPSPNETIIAAGIIQREVDCIQLVSGEDSWQIENLEVSYTSNQQEQKINFSDIQLSSGESFEILAFNTNDRIRIRCEPQPHPWIVRFCVSETVHDGLSAYFGSPEMVEESPLAEKLFATGQIAELIISKYVVTVTSIPGVDWSVLAKKIGSIIRDHIVSDDHSVSPDFHKNLPSEDEIAQEVEVILQEEINPQIASHGGFIRLLEVKDNNVYLEMGGGCQGCGAATMTMKVGVERAIREIIPQLGEIFDKTDHESGVNPYYPRN